MVAYTAAQNMCTINLRRADEQTDFTAPNKLYLSIILHILFKYLQEETCNSGKDSLLT